jgi:C-terminal processing protease CtpA/Prc
VKVKGSVWIVTSCDPASPAAEANIKSGDLINTIDGFGSGHFTEPALYALFRQPAGARLTLEIASGIQSRKVELILRDIL